MAKFVFCLFSSLLARILRLRGCSSTALGCVSLVDDVDDADGLGTLEAASASTVILTLLGLADEPVFAPPGANVVVFAECDSRISSVRVDLAVGSAESPDAADVTEVVTVAALDVDDVIGAGDGELLCICGDELFEPRSTD